MEDVKCLDSNKVLCIPSQEGNVWKYVFDFNGAVAEAVLYKYNDFYERTVICCSVMSGCPIGCSFCGTGRKFIANLSADQIVNQIYHILKSQKLFEDLDANCKKFQIMFMSMGEPMLNWENVHLAIDMLHYAFPNAQLLISTVGVDDSYVFDRILEISRTIDKVGLQFSIHKSNDVDRNELIPFTNKLSLEDISEYGRSWKSATGRNPYLNYCIDGTNNTDADAERLMHLFEPETFCFTFSVICSPDETARDAGFRNLDIIQDFQSKFLDRGYDVRIFDPAGQDDIGGGCGQLWYLQKWMKENNI